MPDHPEERIGDRLRSVRKRRGLTQKELARGAGVSLSLVSKLEQGELTDTRMETAHALARALRVPTTSLLAAHEEAEKAPPSAEDRWAPVRKALLAPVDTLDEPPTVEGLRDALAAAQPLVIGGRFAELGALLPSMLRDADAVAQLGVEGRAVRIRVLQLAGWLMTQTRQFDVADIALERSLDDASDRLQAVATVNAQCWLLLRRGRLAEARELATRWADEMEPRFSRATMTELAAWGWMLVRVSAAAIRDNRAGEAEDALRLAHAAAVAMGREYAPRIDVIRTFGPVTVQLKLAENESISNRPDLVLKRAERLPMTALQAVTRSNGNRHLLTVAHAHTRRRQYAEAVGVLSDVREQSPEWLPNQRFARDILGQVIRRRRTLTPEMRELADTVRLPH